MVRYLKWTADLDKSSASVWRSKPVDEASAIIAHSDDATHCCRCNVGKELHVHYLIQHSSELLIFNCEFDTIFNSLLLSSGRIYFSPPLYITNIINELNILLL